MALPTSHLNLHDPHPHRSITSPSLSVSPTTAHQLHCPTGTLPAYTRVMYAHTLAQMSESSSSQSPSPSRVLHLNLGIRSASSTSGLGFGFGRSLKGLQGLEGRMAGLGLGLEEETGAPAPFNTPESRADFGAGEGRRRVTEPVARGADVLGAEVRIRDWAVGR